MTDSNTEIKNYLKEALQLIYNKDYYEARRLLQNCQDHPLVSKLMTQLDNVAIYSTRVSDNLQSDSNI